MGRKQVLCSGTLTPFPLPEGEKVGCLQINLCHLKCDKPYYLHLATLENLLAMYHFLSRLY